MGLNCATLSCIKTTCNTDDQRGPFSLTRAIYAVCGGILLYLLLEYLGQLLLARVQLTPWGMSHLDLWYHAGNLFFVVAMLCIAIAYRFRAELFHWQGDYGSGSTSWIKSIPLGLLSGAVALLLSSPLFWFGWGHQRLESIQVLIAHAFSPVALFDLLFVILALSVTSEVAFRGVVFRTFAGYASVPAAALLSCLLFAYIFPALGFLVAIILGVTSSILYYKTRNLLAAIFANAVFTVGGSGIALYHRLM